MLECIAKNINILGNFCGKRDIGELTSEQLLKNYRIQQVDVIGAFRWKYNVKYV